MSEIKDQVEIKVDREKEKREILKVFRFERGPELRPPSLLNLAEGFLLLTDRNHKIDKPMSISLELLLPNE